MKAQILAEEEERAFYQGGAGDEWLAALEPIGTGSDKRHLTNAPWLIVVFAQRYGLTTDRALLERFRFLRKQGYRKTRSSTARGSDFRFHRNLNRFGIITCPKAWASRPGF